MTFGPEDEEAFEARRVELVSDFAGWLEQLPVVVDPDDFALLLDWKWGYSDGRLDRWNGADLSDFLLSWCPRKLSAPPEQVCAIPSTVALAMSFLAERGLQGADSAPIEELTEHAVGLQSVFMERMSDPANFGMGKSVFAQLGIDDPASFGPDELQKAMDEFNALPEDLRRAATDSAIRASSQSLPTIGPIQLPGEDVIRASADASVVLEGFAKLTQYLAAPGKQLTAIGNLKIADARNLAGLLQTSDQYEAEIGDRVYRKRSATQFVDLDHWQWWAREAGAIRQKGNKLVGVKAWQQRRRKDPVGEVRRAFNVLTQFGPLGSYWPHLQDTFHRVLDQSVGPLLGRLLQEPGPVEYDELLESWTELMATAGEPELFPAMLNHAFDQLLQLLERAGLVAQDGSVYTPSRYGGANRSAGAVRLTPVGAVIAVDLLEEQGITVQILPRFEEMTASDVAAQAGSGDLDPAKWWGVATNWLDVQPDPAAAVGDLIEKLGNRSLLMLILALGVAPESQRETLTPVLRDLAFAADPPPGELGSVALNWLLQNGVLDGGDVDPDLILDSMLVTFGALAEDDASFVPDLMAEGRDVAEQLELIAAIGRRLPPRAIDLLEAIGSHHPHKAVAKAARKELFRARSRLGEQRSSR